MYIYDIIEKKRNGDSLNKDEINWAVDKYLSGEITDAQMSALLMAITINGMTDVETYDLTKAMQNSGKTYKFDFKSVDKHSTGGVGDSTTFIVVPTLAALGLKVTKMSGKALGFTGGTIDKLNCFDGYNTELTEKEFLNVVDICGCALISQSDKIALADKKMYALRDHTATVDSIPLIASSIMSKKLASGADTILLDVKYGSGAFMKTKSDAVKLAKLMTKIGKTDGKTVKAVISNMNMPLSRGVGCAEEVYSAIKALQGENGNLIDLSIYLASHLYSMATGETLYNSRLLVKDVIGSGRALQKLKEMVVLCGGNTEYIDVPEKLLKAKYVIDVVAGSSGYINYVDALQVAKFVNHLKDNAKTNSDKRQAGVVFSVCGGDRVNKGDVIAKVYSPVKLSDEFVNDFRFAITIGAKNKYEYKLVSEVIK